MLKQCAGKITAGQTAFDEFDSMQCSFFKGDVGKITVFKNTVTEIAVFKAAVRKICIGKYNSITDDLGILDIENSLIINKGIFNASFFFQMFFEIID